MNENHFKPPSAKRLVRVVHRVNQRLVFTDCRHVRDSNVTGFIELIDVVDSDLGGAVGEDHVPERIDSLVLPKLVVVAICYPGDGNDRVVRLHPQQDADPDADAGDGDEYEPDPDDHPQGDG